ncbi:DUF6461 domain-containing protein [Streptosporangium amethystogenes subsp. fukuiense]|uniref:DUF6461 domain-containing protein n=1 Tax=Streptosporangium amethystogenes subsp. fukuiense TaxID=698418 RepID=A0ABW2TAZ0_9ACTN
MIRRSARTGCTSIPITSGGRASGLAERLTGITLTPQPLEESTYPCGVVPRPR